MDLSDPDASRAVLIGVHSYAELPDLPAVKRNLTDLRDALTDREIWGLPPEHCAVVEQPDNAGAVLNAVLTAGRQAEDTLLVYYAGHGLIDQHTDELYLTLPGSDPEFPATALAYTFLRRAIRDSRVRALRKVMILDCCYSGRALEGGMGAAMADRTVTDGTHVLTASGATERAWSPPGEQHTAFTGELITVLDKGIPDGPPLLTTDTIYRHVHTELRAKGRPLPHQHNRDAGGDIALARNRAVSGTPPAPVPAAGWSPAGAGGRRPWTFPRSWRLAARVRTRAKLALVVVATLVVTGATVKILDRVAEPRIQADRVPAVLRDCRVDGPAPAGATTAYSCQDGSGRPAGVQLYPDRKTLNTAYERAVGDADVPPGTGNCGTDEDAEHRYPGTGTAKGRVLCYTGDRVTTVLWTDEEAHTLARIEAPTAGLRGLRDAWAFSTASTPPFPTAAEKRLIDLPVATGCARAAIEELDDFPGAIAAVTCAGTGGFGAQAVTYLQFDTLAKLQKTMNDHIPGDKDPTGVGCEDGEAPKFTGGRRYDVRGVFLGVLLCRPGPGGNLVLEWSVEPLLVAGRAIGVDAEDLARWWQVYRGPPIDKVVQAVNRRDGFPNEAERALLKRIPPRSQRLCMRPSGEFTNEHVGRAPVSAGVVCAPRSGPSIVFYYQFTDRAELDRNYRFIPGAPPGRCTASPTSVTGESTYSRGGATGSLRCENRDGSLTRIWTDERRLIQAFAFQGRDARAMSDWWENDAGPL
jgi:hypothetical protein